ncbi:MAG: NHLP bacteriocin system secretion protein [Deltaproteobacteria bacterium]|nr:NHLP bacteriocin system secretion protein [Deltaproteobacteria bacterium]
MSKQIFRKAALERLSSPEQLDQLMQITSPTGWLALLGTGFFIVAVIVWSIVGSIPTKVTGQGILMKSGGIFDVVANAGGMIDITYFDTGDIVVNRQVVARIQKTDILRKIRNSRAGIDDLEKKYEMIEKYGSQDSLLQTESVQQQQLIVKRAISALRQKISWLEEKIKNQELLYKKGLITRQQVVDTRQQLADAQQSILDNQNNLKKISIDSLQQAEQKEENLKNLQDQINSARRDLEILLKELDESSKVVSQHSGRVLDVAVDAGDIVSAGTTIMRIELMGKNVKSLEGVLYFPPGDGKKIKVGMQAQIAPATVKPQEYGLMLGLVTFVSEFPETEANMTKILHNRTMVQSLVQGGAPIAVRVDPIIDPRTPSGYKWSSSMGPPTTISTGTDCFANVLIKEERPIGMVIPLFKKYILGQE